MPRPSISSPLFGRGRIGPLELRNRTIRSAAFEGSCPDGRPSPALIRYHRKVAAGGVGLTRGESRASVCEPCNRCIALMYYQEAICTEKERLLAGR